MLRSRSQLRVVRTYTRTPGRVIDTNPVSKGRRRWVEKALAAAGLIALDIWLLANANQAIDQAWQGWVFDRELRGQPATFSAFLAEKGEQIKERAGMTNRKPAVSNPEKTPAPKAASVAEPGKPPNENLAENSVLGRLIIPRLQMSTMVREGVGEKTLRVALGHIPSTALPGQTGNIGIAGHRDTLFRALRKIHRNDLILFQTLHGRYAYRVQATAIVGPKDVEVLAPERSPELTLVTCYPFYYVGSAPERFIVKARQVRGAS